MKNKPTTMFMGTPEFAVPTLRALVDAGYNVTAVVTQTDKPKGRSKKLVPPPVKEAALELGIAVYQPTTLRGDDFAALLAEVDPELIVVAAYGKILPQNVLDYPKYGCINVHASLLPNYRGADPIRRSIIDGREVTGVTVMHMDAGIDTGAMYGKVEVEITDTDNCETLTSKLSNAGAELLLPTLERIIDGDAIPKEQNDDFATFAPKLSDEEIVLDFNKSAYYLERLVRACDPAPVAETTLGDVKIKVTAAAAVEYADMPDDAPCGFAVVTKKEIFVKCGVGALQIRGVVPAGRKPMDAQAFINGRGIQNGDRFGVIRNSEFGIRN